MTGGGEQLEKRDGLLEEVDDLLERGEHARAIEVLRQVLAIERQELPADDLEISETLTWLAQIESDADRFEQARAALADARCVLDMSYEPPHWRIVDVVWELRQVDLVESLSPEDRSALRGARLDSDRSYEAAEDGEGAEAVALAQRALEVHERLLAPPHPILALNLYYLGFALHRREKDDLPAAEQHYRRALAMQEDLYLRDAWSTHRDLAMTMHGLASLLCDRARVSEDPAPYREALVLYRRTAEMDQLLYDDSDDYPRKHAQWAQSVGDVGYVLNKLGNLGGARRQFELSLALFELVFPREDFPHGHEELVKALESLADVCDAQQDRLAADVYRQRQRGMRTALRRLRQSSDDGASQCGLRRT